MSEATRNVHHSFSSKKFKVRCMAVLVITQFNSQGLVTLKLNWSCWLVYFNLKNNLHCSVKWKSQLKTSRNNIIFASYLSLRKILHPSIPELWPQKLKLINCSILLSLLIKKIFIHRDLIIYHLSFLLISILYEDGQS